MQALIRSREYSKGGEDLDLGAIYDCTAGVVFFGTPHRGSNKTELAEILTKIAKIALIKPNEKLVRALAQDSDVIEAQRRSWTSVCNSIPIVSLCEEKPSGIGMVWFIQPAGHSRRPRGSL
jgi:hypothetical protein